MLVASGKSATIGNLVTITKAADFNINGLDAAAAGTLNIGSGGTVTTNGNFRLSLFGNGSVVNVKSGGQLKTIAGALTTGAIQIGGTTGSSTVNVEAGGTMSTATGGIRVGASSGGTGNLNVSGIVSTTTGIVYVGYSTNTNGTLSINSGGLVDTSASTAVFQMGQNASAISTGTLNLNTSGTLFVKKVVFGAAAINVIKFDGGEVKAAATDTTFLAGGGAIGSGLNVHDGGVTFNSNTFDITVAGALAHSTLTGAAATDGGLTKTGTGTLTLSNANTYNGDTKITLGTLALTNALAIQSSAFDTSGAGNMTLNKTTPTFGGLKGSTDIATAITTGYSNVTALTLNPGANNSPSYGGAISNGAAGMTLTKSGPGTQTLSGANTYTGATTVNAGKLVVNGNQPLAIGATTVAAGTLNGTPVATLSGNGGIGGDVSLVAESASGFKNGGILAPTASASGTALDVAGTTTFGIGSIFVWNMSATTPASDPGSGTANSGAYSQLAGVGLISGSGAVFNIVLGVGNAFTDVFWDTSKTWNNIFSSTGSSTNLSSIFSNFGGTGVTDTSGTGVTSRGTFTFSGTNTLNWTAVPEPTSALAGLLLGAGLLRRRRNA